MTWELVREFGSRMEPDGLEQANSALNPIFQKDPRASAGSDPHLPLVKTRLARLLWFIAIEGPLLLVG